MAKHARLKQKILAGSSDGNIDFPGLCRLLRHLGFEERVRGSHHIFTREGTEEIINLQSKEGKAKAYQVKQVRGLLVKYRLGDSDAD